MTLYRFIGHSSGQNKISYLSFERDQAFYVQISVRLRFSVLTESKVLAYTAEYPYNLPALLRQESLLRGHSFLAAARAAFSFAHCSLLLNTMPRGIVVVLIAGMTWPVFATKL
jgi:hypothetical protein